MAEHESGEDFLIRLETGSKSALDEVCQAFADRLLALAEREIGARLRVHYAPEDAIVSALGSFCRRAAEGHYRFDHSGAVWRLLRTITLNKIRRAANRRRNEIDATGDNTAEDVSDREPSHEEVVEHAELIERFVGRFKPRDEEILRLWLQGYSSVEIATQVGVSKWTVDRTLKSTRDFVDKCLAKS